MYLTKRGNVPASRRILDSFIQLLYASASSPVRLLAARYGAKSDIILDGAVDTGNNAWVGLAFAHFAAATGEPCYGRVAFDILDMLKTLAGGCNDYRMGFTARLDPYPQHYRSTEHNIDVFALAHILGDTIAEHRAQMFVHSMYGAEEAFQTPMLGTSNSYVCDDTVPGDSPVFVDTIFWNILAGANKGRWRVEDWVEFATRPYTFNQWGFVTPDGLWDEDVDLIGGPSGANAGETMYGFRFSSHGDGIQWENTASGLMAMIKYNASFVMPDALRKNVSDKIGRVSLSLRRLLAAYGSVPASVLGGNMKAYQSGDRHRRFPGGSDTGQGWNYMRYPHLAATAFTGLALLYKFDSEAPVDEGANPYQLPGMQFNTTWRSADLSTCVRTT
jgi:hypothetical protein